MRDKLLALVYAAGGAISRDQALAALPEHVIDDAVRAGVVVSLFPGVYAATELADDPNTRRHAALLYVPSGALSHLDALDIWGLAVGEVERPQVHLTAPRSQPFSDVPGLVLHRRKSFTIGAPRSLIRNGVRVVRLEQAVIESWPLLPEIDRRVPAIVATRERLTHPTRLLATLRRNGRIEGCAEMRSMFGLLAAGCHSPLEVWGHQNVFAHPSLPRSRAQLPLRIGNRLIYLDRAFEEEMVDAELDGAAYHGSPGQRERDLRRDAAVARLGWLPVRFSHLRLHADPADVRAELVDILRMRRRQLGIRGA